MSDVAGEVRRISIVCCCVGAPLPGWCRGTEGLRAGSEEWAFVGSMLAFPGSTANPPDLMG